MKLLDLYESSTPDVNLPDDIEHTLPHALIFPDMNNEFEYYQFVVAMASHPEISNEFYQNKPLRDVPIAVANSKQEFEMIKQVAKRLGQRWEKLTTYGSQESPGGNTVSPVMKFNMTESDKDIFSALLEVVEKN